MSIARKCNKCKKFFDPLSENEPMASFINPVFRTSMDIAENYHGKYLCEEAGPEGVIDLCPDCSKQFRRFMDNKMIINIGAQEFTGNTVIDETKSAIFNSPYKKYTPCPKLKFEDMCGGDFDGD